jgi:hypothetical protein
MGGKQAEKHHMHIDDSGGGGPCNYQTLFLIQVPPLLAISLSPLPSED